MPRMMASRPSDSGRAYFSSIRSASWTISAISRSTGSPRRSYSLRKVSKEQSSPRWESLAPTTSKSSAPSGASAGSPKKEKAASGSIKRRINQTQAVCPDDDGSIGLLPRGTEGFHQLGFLGHGPWPGLPQSRLSPGLPHPELQPLQLLAGYSVFGERRHPVL